MIADIKFIRKFTNFKQCRTWQYEPN